MKNDQLILNSCPQLEQRSPGLKEKKQTKKNLKADKGTNRVDIQ